MIRNLCTNTIFFLIVVLSINCGYSATEDNNQVANNNNANAQQMIKEIKQLQQKQEQQAATEFGTTITNPANSSNNQNSIQSESLKRRLAKAPQYDSDFQYPHPRAQIQNSATMSELKNNAFEGAVQQVLPLEPQQIHRLKQIYDAAQFAAAAPAGIPPKPVATSILVNLSPGSSPPAIRLSAGFVSSLVFLDSTGAPWPIDAYDLGNPSAFNIAWDKKDNVLMIQAKTLYTYGNLAVQLRGLNTPIMLTLIPGQKVVDYRIDITVPGYGPDAKSLPINTGLPPQATPILLSVLDGVPPEGSTQLHISQSIGQAWTLNNKMYLRTHYTLLSPGWLATMSSADGTNAYELQATPMLLISKNGKIEQVKVRGL